MTSAGLHDSGEIVRGTVVVRGTMTMLVVVCLAGAAAAEDEPPCLADVKRLCNQVPPTGKFVQGCLEANRAALSARCRKHVGTLTRDTDKLNTACQRDLGRLCDDGTIRAGKQVGCLVEHRDTLSATCRDALDEQSHD